jgi:hypothetical protein
MLVSTVCSLAWACVALTTYGLPAVKRG